MEKIEAGGELNCMSRGLGCDDKAAAGKWTTRSTLQPHWLDCTHTNWILKKPRDPSPTRPEAVYSGFREVSDKGGGWVEVRNRGVTFFTRIQGSCCCCCCCCRYCCCSCLPVLQGGFSSLSALGGVAHRRLGEPSRPAAAADAQKKKKKGLAGTVRRAPQSWVERTYFSFATLCTQAEDFCRHKPPWFFLFFLSLFLSSDHLLFCERMYLLSTFGWLKCARAAGIFFFFSGGVACVIFYLSSKRKRESTKRI